MLPDTEILALHRAIVQIPSVSGNEAALADFLTRWLEARGVRSTRLGNTLLATTGRGPMLLLDTHIDTVPPGSGWTREPFEAGGDNGQIWGLGANDAKASVAAMAAAFVACAAKELPVTVTLALVEGEENRGIGTQAVVAELHRRTVVPTAAVVGEPTGLDVAVAQKGLLILELVATGDQCHAAHAAALGARNAARVLARDLVALEGLDLGGPHPSLGAMTLEPTQLRGASARNVVPGEAAAILDVRTTPTLTHDEIRTRVARAVSSEVRVVSSRLRATETAADAGIVAAALRARPGARIYGSATMSDMTFLDGIPAIKCGPGQSERSHRPDEFVLANEVLDGAHFYAGVIAEFAAMYGGAE